MNIFGIFHGLLVTQPQVRNLKGVQARREGRDRDKEGRSEFGPLRDWEAEFAFGIGKRAFFL